MDNVMASRLLRAIYGCDRDTVEGARSILEAAVEFGRQGELAAAIGSSGRVRQLALETLDWRLYDDVWGKAMRGDNTAGDRETGVLWASRNEKLTAAQWVTLVDEGTRRYAVSGFATIRESLERLAGHGARSIETLLATEQWVDWIVQTLRVIPQWRAVFQTDEWAQGAQGKIHLEEIRNVGKICQWDDDTMDRMVQGLFARLRAGENVQSPWGKKPIDALLGDQELLGMLSNKTIAQLCASYPEAALTLVHRGRGTRGV